MEKLTALVVDDEPKAVALLNKLLDETDEFSHVICANSAAEALKKIESLSPHLIFLDIKMPGTDGFALLEDIRGKQLDPEIIFVTAYDQFALEAIRTHAFGYLLKPVSREELHECIRDFRSRKKNLDALDRLSIFLRDYRLNRRIRINTRSGYFFIDSASILYCQAEGNYTVIQLGDKEHVCTLQLGVIQEMLPAPDFLRIGRSLIVNTANLLRLDRKKGHLVFERQGAEFVLNVSRFQRRELDKLKVGNAYPHNH